LTIAYSVPTDGEAFPSSTIVAVGLDAWARGRRV
jgi:hypothetical protein